jgi:hypothetical protein
MLPEDFGLSIKFARGFQTELVGRGSAVEPEAVPMGVIQREIVEPRPAEPLLKRVEVVEIIPSDEQLDAFAMAGHAHIRQMAVRARRGEHETALDRYALRLVHGRGVAVIERGLIGELEFNFPTVMAVQPDPQRSFVDFEHLAKRAVLDAQLTVILEEHHSFAAGEVAFAALDSERPIQRHQLTLDLDRYLPSELSPLPQNLPGR